MPPTFHAIIAVDDKHGIGKDGGLPWHIPADLKRFTRLTSGVGRNAVIMGRKTWDSLPARFKPLQNRLNIVMTKKGAPIGPGELMVASKREAETVVHACDQVFIIGGPAIYDLFKEQLDSVHITRVKGDHACTVRYDENRLIGSDMTCTISEEVESNGYTITFADYELMH